MPHDSIRCAWLYVHAWTWRTRRHPWTGNWWVDPMLACHDFHTLSSRQKNKYLHVLSLNQNVSQLYVFYCFDLSIARLASSCWCRKSCRSPNHLIMFPGDEDEVLWYPTTMGAFAPPGFGRSWRFSDEMNGWDFGFFWKDLTIIHHQQWWFKVEWKFRAGLAVVLSWTKPTDSMGKLPIRFHVSWDIIGSLW